LKIAILTFHASHNYGSVLQAYALSEQLKLLGHEVEIINLRSENQKRVFKRVPDSPTLLHKVFYLLNKKRINRRYDKYEYFINNVLPVTKKEYQTCEQLKEVENVYDAYVCGSDQIWNPVCQDFSTAYYLEFLQNTCKAKRIAYAPSFGRHEFDEETTKQINAWAKNFDSISVRELKGKAVLNEIDPERISVVCDPVVLLDKKYWEELAAEPNIKEPYMLVYFLENNHGRKDFVDTLSQQLGLKVVVLTEYLRDMAKPYIKKYDASPEEFVGLFKNASFVYTNSFHGTAFATIFNKPFITVIAPDQENAVNNNDSRKIDYLTKIGLEGRLVQNDLPCKDELMKVDYEEANEKMQEFRNDSYRYLKNALEE